MDGQTAIKTLKQVGDYLLTILTPLRLWVYELKDVNVLKADIVSGVTVALVLVPQSMAYAQLAGLPTYYGLYASFVPVIVATVFGSSRQLATGPVAVVSLLTASALGPLASMGTPEYFAYAVTLAFVIGIIQLVLGLVRLGVMVAFLSHPVVVGFTNAAAIVIATSQLDKIFGVQLEQTFERHYETVWAIVMKIVESTHYPTLGIAVLSLAIMFFFRQFLPRVPGVLIAVVVTILLSWGFNFEAHGGQVVGNIPMGLPSFEMPELGFSRLTQLLGVALAIALIGFTEAISIAKTMAAQTRQPLSADQELIGQGLSNISASFFQAYAVSGSFSRSAVNFDSGAVTGFSSIVTGLIVAITLVFLTPLLYHLPQPTLAAVIMIAVAGLIRIEPVVHIWRAQKHDGIVAAVTFVLTLVYAPHLETGILIGVLLSLGLYVYRTMRPHVTILARHNDGDLRDAERQILQQCPKIALIRFEGPLFFANTSYFETRVLERVATMPSLRFIIIDAISINEIDATGDEMLRSLSRTLVSQKIEFLFARVQAEVMDTMKRSRFASPEWEDHFFRTRDAALKYAWNHLLSQKDTTCKIDQCHQMPDLSACVLQRNPNKEAYILETLYGSLKKPKSPDAPTS